MDVFTGLASRRHFDQILEGEWRRAIRDRTPLSRILLDIDRFKGFNDLYGHPAGDGCLRAVAEALRSGMNRPEDIAARYGGEEFAPILSATEASDAEQVADAVRTAVAALQITHAENTSGGGLVTASLGVSTACPQAGGPPNEWLELIAEANAIATTPELRSYVKRQGIGLGALCVIDTSARAETSPAQRVLLTVLAKMVATLLDEKITFSNRARSFIPTASVIGGFGVNAVFILRGAGSGP